MQLRDLGNFLKGLDIFKQKKGIALLGTGGGSAGFCTEFREEVKIMAQLAHISGGHQVYVWTPLDSTDPSTLAKDHLFTDEDLDEVDYSRDKYYVDTAS